MIRRQSVYRVTVLIIFSLLVFSLFAYSPVNAKANKAKYAPNLIKVKLSADAISRTSLPTGLYAQSTSFGINELDQLLFVKGGQKVIRAHRKVKDTAWEAQTGFDRWFLIELDGKSTVEEAIASFKSNRYIEDATPEYYAYTTAVPNDTYYPNNWGHNNTAQLPVYSGGSHSGAGVGTVGFDNDSQLAWDQSQGYGSASIIIAIIDTGVDTAHPDLRLVAGYDYGVGDANPMDDSADPGHGTACSGVAAGIANNGIGVTGVAGGCSVMPLKIASADGSLGFTAINNAITHCGDNNVNVASMSFGAEEGMAEGDSPSTDAALEYAYSHGVTLLAATANSNASAIAYPSNHNKVISVGAASPTGQRKSTTSSDGENWWGSNYGTAVMDAALAVDIMAPTILPATDITGAGNGYNTSSDYYMWFNGTSCSTPFAAGVAALLLSKDPTLTPAQVRTAITSTATDMTFDGGVGWDRYTGYGMVNANAALNSLVPGLPSCSITSPANGSAYDLNSIITVNVTATDTDGTISQVQFFIDDSAVASYTDYSSPYTWNWDTTGQASGAHTIKAVATDNSSNTAQSQISITLLAPADEGFETGNLSAFGWANSNATYPWAVQSAEKFSGTYSAKSGAIGNSSNTSLSITLNITSNANISFYREVSSEASYDFLKFYIDNVETGSWSGEQAWAVATYPVTAGSRTFRWTYSKDVSDTGGSDCAWIDHIVFPPYAVTYDPAQNLTGAAADQKAILSWQAPAGVAPNSYKVFRNGSQIANVNALTYTDEPLTNGTTYSYYVIAVYSGGESVATASIQVTPNIVTSAIIGSGTGFTGTQEGAPINIYYKSLHGQSIYTAAELTAAGITGPINFTEIGFYINSSPTLALPNFKIRMKHTTATNVASWQSSTDLQTVYSVASYAPTAGGYQMLTLSTPFTWNGVDNILVDTAFSPVATYSSTGTVQYTTITNGYRYIRNDGSDQTAVFTGGSASTFRPNIKLTFAPLPTEPEIVVSTSSLDFGTILTGGTVTREFTINNSGSGALSGNIQYPNTFSVSENGAKNLISTKKDSKGTLAYTVNAGSMKTFTVSFTASEVGAVSETITISHNAEGADKSIALSAFVTGYQAVPFVEGFENGLNGWMVKNENQINKWYHGTATKQTGSSSVFISNDSGTSNSYSVDNSSVSHLYRDIQIPASENGYKLRFGIQVQGEGTSTKYDYLRVYLQPSANELIAGVFPNETYQIGDTYNMLTGWQNIEIDVPNSFHGQNAKLTFVWRNDGSLGTQPPAAIDNIRIVEGEQNDVAVVIGGDAELILPPVTTPESNVITPSISITNLGIAEEILAYSSYASGISDYQSAGLELVLSGATFSGATISVNHGLGFAPAQIAYRIVPGGWTILTSISPNVSLWNATTITFTPSAKADGDLEVVFGDSEDSTLPITLASFTAALTANGFVKLDWRTESETGVLGYYVLRSETDDLLAASAVSALIDAENTADGSVYSFVDSDLQYAVTYYYWLQNVDISGAESFFGPLPVSTLTEEDNPLPQIPTVTKLMGNYPNPFNPNTNLRYSLDKAANVKISIYNNRGQMVRSYSNSHNEPGYYSLGFDGKDNSGRELSSGVYYYRMNTGSYTQTKRMLLLK